MCEDTTALDANLRATASALVPSIIENSLAAMLQCILRIGDGLKLSLEAQLARQLVAHPEDLATQNKLKPIRLCKVFCTSQSNLQLALIRFICR